MKKFGILHAVILVCFLPFCYFGWEMYQASATKNIEAFWDAMFWFSILGAIGGACSLHLILPKKDYP